jgi:hypothetical protein
VEDIMRKTTQSLCIIALVAAAIAPASPGETQDGGTRREQLWLARSCVHELTWNTEHDCEPMYQALMGTLDAMERTSGRRRSLVDAIRIYQRRLWGGTSTRPWARELTPGLRSNPLGWPEGWPAFFNYTGDFDRVYEQAGTIVRGEVTTACVERPRHWGSRDPRLPDAARARRAIEAGRWREVDCGPTLQAYYAVVTR